MRRTRPFTLFAIALCGLWLAFLGQGVLAAVSAPKFQPELGVSASFLLIGVLVVVLAIPLWRTTRGKRRGPIDPFYATRVVVLAKASAIVGAAVTGVGLGLVQEMLTRTVAPSGDGVVRITALAVAGVVLLVGGLVAEHLCTVPPDRDDHADGRGPGRDGPGRGGPTAAQPE